MHITRAVISDKLRAEGALISLYMGQRRRPGEEREPGPTEARKGKPFFKVVQTWSGISVFLELLRMLDGPRRAGMKAIVVDLMWACEARRRAYVIWQFSGRPLGKQQALSQLLGHVSMSRFLTPT